MWYNNEATVQERRRTARKEGPEGVENGAFVSRTGISRHADLGGQL